jgi:hypothetical protein
MARHSRTGTRAAALAIVAMVVAGCGSSTPSGGPSQTTLGATSQASEGAAPTPAPPNAEDVIQADVDAGKIDQATGDLYRIEAEFGAKGLPAQYASAAVGEDQAALDMAALDLAKMPAAIQAELTPFLVRPTDPRSVFHGKAAALTAPAPAAAAVNGSTGRALADAIGPDPAAVQPAPPGADLVCDADGWESATSASLPITVWGECGTGHDPADLTRALAAIESTYPDEVRIMGDPIPDTGDADAGGSPNIDIYLADHCVTRDGECNDLSTRAAAVTVPTSPFVGAYASQKCSAFILISRGYAGSPVDLKSILTHEMFHVLEDAHNARGRVQAGHSYWMTEASAEWSEEFLVPEGRPQWVYPWFNDFEGTDVGLTTINGRNEYSDFIWPHFMNLVISPDSIGKAWKAFEGKVGWDSFNSTLSGILDFKTRFKDFAVTAWNSPMPGGGTPDLIDPKFQAPDGSFPKTPPAKPTKFYFRHPNAVKLTDPAIKVPETMPPLSARYAELELGDDTQQLIVDFSGLQPEGALDVTALIHIKGGQWEKRTLPPAKTTFCRAKEDVDRVLFVLDNNSYKDGSTIGGTWQYQAVTDACSPGSFNITVANGPEGKHAGAGTYNSDQASIDCSESNNVWDAGFADKNGLNGIEGITIDMNKPEFVIISTVSHNDNVDEFDVQEGLDSTVSISVDDQGKIVKLTAHATSLFAKIDATVTCGSILRA